MQRKKNKKNKKLFDFYSRNYLYPDYRSSSTPAGFVVSFSPSAHQARRTKNLKRRALGVECFLFCLRL